MSLTHVPFRIPDLDLRPTRRWRRLGHSSLAWAGRTASAADAAVRRLLLAAARLVDWFAADTRRISAALSGLLVCASVGAALGLGAGLVVGAVVEWSASVVRGP